MFNSVEWRTDRAVLNELTFRLEQFRTEDWDGGEEHFRFYKRKYLVDQYQSFFSRHPEFKPQNIFEIGIYDGGSTAFWFEILTPSKLVAIDFLDRGDNAYFTHWLESRSLQDRVKTQWRTNQANQTELKRLVHSELNDHIDLVIDDASHLYGPTKASFEALFPYCKPGSIYIIEDWGWDHWKDFSAPDHEWAHEQRLTQLVIELVEAVGTSDSVIAGIEVFQGFIAIKRGHGHLEPGAEFSLDKLIHRRPVAKTLGASTKRFATQNVKPAMAPLVRALKTMARPFRSRSK